MNHYFQNIVFLNPNLACTLFQSTQRNITSLCSFRGPTYKLLLSFTVISDVYRSFIQNKTTFTKYCLIQWMPKLLRSFDIHWRRQYLVNFMGLVGIVNATVNKTKPIFAGLRRANFLIFNTAVLSARNGLDIKDAGWNYWQKQDSCVHSASSSLTALLISFSLTEIS